jgi:hypothetical protein
MNTAIKILIKKGRNEFNNLKMSVLRVFGFVY